MSKARTRPEANVVAGGFGFDPAESVHHFLVNIPAGKNDAIEISEHLTWSPVHGSSPASLATQQEDGQLRVRLARAKWDAIADAVRAEFNRRLRILAKKPGIWKRGMNPFPRLFGKELVLLAWAIEDADPSLIPNAIANWLGLACEERWWLYTMTCAATGHFQSNNKGWRKAVRFALTENAVGSMVHDHAIVPEFFQSVARKEQEEADSLFSVSSSDKD